MAAQAWSGKTGKASPAARGCKRQGTDCARPGNAPLLWVLGLYLAIVLPQAAKKLLWVDELITFYIARTGGLRAIWNALAAGADPNPPLIHAAVMLSIRWFGDSALAVRFPSILFVALALVSMWTILRRWVPPLFATAGLLAYMTTRGFDFAYDARSYAPMMGLAMLSLALWLEASHAGGARRWLAISGMTLALAGGISANYYGVLAFFPIASGEGVLGWQQWRQAAAVRSGVWAGLGVGALPLLAFLPLIRHNLAEFGPHAWNPPRVSMIGFSYVELVEGIFWPVVALAVAAWWKRRSAEEPALPSHSRAALMVLLAYPFLGFAIAVGGGGMISPRCVAPVCCGFGLAAAVLGQRVLGRARRAGVTMICVLVLWVVVRESICMQILKEQRRAFLALRDEVRTAVAANGGQEQILVADSSFALPLFFLSDDDVKARIVYPIDFAAIHRLEPDDSGEENLWGGRDGVFPFQVIPLHQLRLNGPALVIARPGGWLATALRESGSRLVPAGDPPGNWDRVGGVFTPMAHPETRLMQAYAAE